MLARFDKTLLDGKEHEFCNLHNPAIKASRGEQQVEVMDDCCLALIALQHLDGQAGLTAERHAAALDEVCTMQLLSTNDDVVRHCAQSCSFCHCPVLCHCPDLCHCCIFSLCN